MSIIYTNAYNHVYMCASVYTCAMWVSPRNAGFFRCCTSFPSTRGHVRKHTEELWFDLMPPDEHKWDLWVWVELNAANEESFLRDDDSAAKLFPKVLLTSNLYSLWTLKHTSLMSDLRASWLHGMTNNLKGKYSFQSFQSQCQWIYIKIKEQNLKKLICINISVALNNLCRMTYWLEHQADELFLD